MRTVVVTVAVLALAGTGGFLLFGRGRSQRSDAASSARYCQLAGQLDQVSVGSGAASASGVYDGTADKFRLAVGQMGDSLNEFKIVAPQAVKHDTGVVVEALRRAALGDPSRVNDPAFTRTAQRLDTYRSTHCVTGGGSTGEG